MNKTMEKMGDLEIEIQQMNGHLGSIKLEISNLEKRRAALIEEAAGIKLNVEADAQKRMNEGRKATEKMLEDREIFEAEKRNFAEKSMALGRDTVAVQRAREEAENTINNYKAMRDKLTRFIVMVKRESELL